MDFLSSLFPVIFETLCFQESNMATPEHNYKVSPPPFVPLTAPTTINVEQLQNVVLPGGPPPPTVVIVTTPKPAPSFASYETTCYSCQVCLIYEFLILTISRNNAVSRQPSNYISALEHIK